MKKSGTFVQVWDFSSHLNYLAESEDDTSRGEASVFNQAPLSMFKHKDEGYAIDWSPLVPGRLVSGKMIASHCVDLMDSYW